MRMKSSRILPYFFLFLIVSGVGFVSSVRAETKPKYGPEAERIALAHEYFRTHAAPTFWTMIPYYLPQSTDHSCSLASVTMVVNAARAFENLTADDELATEAGMLKKIKDPAWKTALDGGHGVTLDELGKFAEEALGAYGVALKKVAVIHAPEGNGHDGDAQAALTFDKQVHEWLVLLEKSKPSDRTFIIANFIQGVYTGDAPAGHIAPVGAYDAAKKRVLILDPDRQWYEPYWVSEKTFIRGMSTRDPQSSKTRGMVWIQLAAPETPSAKPTPR